MAQAADVRAALVPALLGNEASFTTIAQGASFLADRPPSSPAVLAILDGSRRKNIQQLADALAQRRGTVLAVHRALKAIRQMSAEVQNAAHPLLVAELVNSAPAAQISAANALEMLSQRLGKSAAEFITCDSLDPEAVFLLGKDAKSFAELLAGMRDGNPNLRLRPAKTPESKQALAELDRKFSGLKEQVDKVLSQLQDLVAAREAQQRLLTQLNALDKALQPICFTQQ
jgi:twitching motility protein PilJ